MSDAGEQTFAVHGFIEADSAERTQELIEALGTVGVHLFMSGQNQVASMPESEPDRPINPADLITFALETKRTRASAVIVWNRLTRAYQRRVSEPIALLEFGRKPATLVNKSVVTASGEYADLSFVSLRRLVATYDDVVERRGGGLAAHAYAGDQIFGHSMWHSMDFLREFVSSGEPTEEER
jgi:hypothetical protein